MYLSIKISSSLHLHAKNMLTIFSFFFADTTQNRINSFFFPLIFQFSYIDEKKPASLTSLAAFLQPGIN